MPVRIRKANKLHKILYPLMAIAMVAPIFASASTFQVTANAARRQRVVRQAPRRRRGRKVRVIYASYQRNSLRQRKRNGYGRYVIHYAYIPANRVGQRRGHKILGDWKATPQNRRQLQRLVNKRNRSLKHSKRAPRNTPYIVPNHNALMLGSESSSVNANQNIHNGLVPVQIKSRTTLWDIARANMKHVSRYTTRRSVDKAADVLLKLNRKQIKGIHQTLKKGTQILVPSNQAKTLKTNFTPWAEFTAGLSKSAIRDKRWIANVESNGRYNLWQGHRRFGSRKVPYGKYQLDAGYLHMGKKNADNGHAWDSPYTQEDIANKYVFGRYHTWHHAYRFHKKHGWY